MLTLTEVLHRIVAHAWVYDSVQILAGIRRIQHYVRSELAKDPPVPLALDIGGGTGIARTLLQPESTYVCLDEDMVKLRGYRKKYPGRAALLADGARLPVRSASIELIFCMSVFHHIPEFALEQVISEMRRVLTSTGKLILVDPIWAPRRRVGRLIWRYDRGAYPRRPEVLDTLLAEQFGPLRRERFAYWHEYLMWVGRPLPTVPRELSRAAASRVEEEV